MIPKSVFQVLLSVAASAAWTCSAAAQTESGAPPEITADDVSYLNSIQENADLSGLTPAQRVGIHNAINNAKTRGNADARKQEVETYVNYALTNELYCAWSPEDKKLCGPNGWH